MNHPVDSSVSYSWLMDADDPLSGFKKQFLFPQYNFQDCIYFCGNSLGLQPRQTAGNFSKMLDQWGSMAINGYFGGNEPWLYYQDQFNGPLAKIVGAKPEEVVAMNALTVNLHLLMDSFYRPEGKRTKIIMEAGAFPSDQYAVAAQLARFGLSTKDHLIEISPEQGAYTLHTEQILREIKFHQDELALVLLGGINYYTGQLFNIKAITEATHAAGAVSGWDLAHAAGNVELSLHNWEVDFAVWCSYKYLNGGPGAVGGAYIHEKHIQNIRMHRLSGWWGNEEKERFKMEKSFIPKANASGWSVSTVQVFNMIGLKSSLDIFESAQMESIRKKSIALTGYLEMLLKSISHLDFEIITPSDPACRGAQLSLFFKENGKAIHEQLTKMGVVVDFREPGVIRVAPNPLYCSFEDVHRFYEVVRKTNL